MALLSQQGACPLENGGGQQGSWENDKPHPERTGLPPRNPPPDGRAADALRADPAERRPGQHERALAEAQARRAEADGQEAGRAPEVGRKGPDPARYGDWEKNGIASDF